jgi:RNA polymerase sigma factor (sigma-70 family)
MAQSNLYHLYCDAMYNVCYRILAQREDAEDALQYGFVEVFQQLQTFKFESTIGAWIKRIIVNRCIDQLRKRKWKFDELDGQESYEDINDDVELDMSNVKMAINQLSEGYRAVFNLYAIEGYDHEEISDIMSISVSTSKSQYHRAKHKVYDFLLNNGGKSSLYK